MREPGRTNRGRLPLATMVLALVGALLGGLAVVSVAAPATAADTYTPIRLNIDSTRPSRGEASGCWAVFGSTGENRCEGRYDDASTAPFRNDHGTVIMNRPSDTAPMAVNFYVLGGELLGSVPNEASDAYTVTSGLTSWGTNIRTGNVAGAAPGTEGGPLKLKVTGHCFGTDVGSCNYLLEADGFVLHDAPPGPVPESNDTIWRTFQFSFTTLSGPDNPCVLGGRCNGHYSVGGDEAFGMSQPGWVVLDPTTSSPIPLAFFSQLDGGGLAALAGTVELFSPRYAVTRADVPWGTGVTSVNDPQRAAGSQGGPLYLERFSVGGGDQPALTVWSVRGWLNYTPRPPSATPGPGVATPVAVVPRFTG